MNIQSVNMANLFAQIIGKLRNINTTPTEKLRLRLRERQTFWVKKLKTLTPYSLNQERN